MFLREQGIRSFCDIVDDPDACLGGGVLDIVAAAPTFIFIATKRAIFTAGEDTRWLGLEVQRAVKSKCRIVVLKMAGVEYGEASALVSTMLKCAETVDVLGACVETAALRSLAMLLRSNSSVATSLTRGDFEKFLNGVYAAVRFKSDRRWLHERLRCIQYCCGRESTSELVTMLMRTADICEPSLRSTAMLAIIAARLSLSTHLTDARTLLPALLDAITNCGPNRPKIRQSSQGFLTMPLYSHVQKGRIRHLLRLHLWPGAEARSASPFLIHSHQTHVKSWILSGAIENTTWSVVRSSENTGVEGHSLFHVEWDGLRSYRTHHRESTIRNSGTRVVTELRGSSIFRAGQCYAVPAGDFHSSQIASTEDAMTLAFFDADMGWVENAPVVGPVDRSTYTSRRRASLSKAQFMKSLGL